MSAVKRAEIVHYRHCLKGKLGALCNKYSDQDEAIKHYTIKFLKDLGEASAEQEVTVFVRGLVGLKLKNEFKEVHELPSTLSLYL